MGEKMKKLIIALCILLFSTATAYAGGELSCEDGESKTGSTWYHQHCYVDKDTHLSHEKRKDPAGVGADLVLWQNETEKAKFIEEFVAEYRYDINNEEHSIFGVVRVNLWDKIKGIFTRD